MRIIIYFVVTFIIFASCSDGNSALTIEYKKGDFWIDNFKGNVFPSKIYYKDKIYCTGIEISSGKPNYLYCLNLKTGTVDWATEVKGWASEPPIVTDDFIYFSSYTGNLCKLNKQGTVLWSQDTDGSFAGLTLNPLNNNLLVNTVENGVLEYDFATGKKIFHYGKHILRVTPPVFINDCMYIGGLNKDTSTIAIGAFIYCFNNKTRKIVWKRQTVENSKMLFANSDNIYFADEHPCVYAIDAATGKQKWKSKNLPRENAGLVSIYPKMIFEDNNLFFFDVDVSKIYRFNSITGDFLGIHSYSQIIKEGLVLPQKHIYNVKGIKNRYTITVTDSLGSAHYNNFKTYDVLLKKTE